MEFEGKATLAAGDPRGTGKAIALKLASVHSSVAAGCMEISKGY
jgi:hypothetical protein